MRANRFGSFFLAMSLAAAGCADINESGAPEEEESVDEARPTSHEHLLGTWSNGAVGPGDFATLTLSEDASGIGHYRAERREVCADGRCTGLQVEEGTFWTSARFLYLVRDGRTARVRYVARDGGLVFRPYARVPTRLARLPAHCGDPAVRALLRPVDPRDPSSALFPVRFRHDAGEDAARPTVVYLAGGPGQTGTDARNPAVPPAFGYVAADLRGVGCSTHDGGALPERFYRTDVFATDTLAIVRELGLTNYMLYGVSYGTYLATVTGSSTRAAGVPRPSAVVLEGVLGRSLRRGENHAGYHAVWSRFLERVAAGAPEVHARLTGDPLPFGLSPEAWGAFVQSRIGLGVLPGTPTTALGAALVPGLVPGADAQAEATLAEQVRAAAQSHVPEDGRRLYRYVSCHEIQEHAAGYDSDFALVRGELVPHATDLCGDIPLDRPYDAARYPLQGRVYYFTGTADPATPPALGAHHYHAQTRAARTYVEVEGGGHNPLAFTLGACRDAIWAAMADGSDLGPAVANCGVEAAVVVPPR